MANNWKSKLQFDFYSSCDLSKIFLHQFVYRYKWVCEHQQHAVRNNMQRNVFYSSLALCAILGACMKLKLIKCNAYKVIVFVYMCMFIWCLLARRYRALTGRPNLTDGIHVIQAECKSSSTHRHLHMYTCKFAYNLPTYAHIHTHIHSDLHTQCKFTHRCNCCSWSVADSLSHSNLINFKSSPHEIHSLQNVLWSFIDFLHSLAAFRTKYDD